MKVLVIGAGAAGLAAAQTLARAGVKTLIVEARDRTGGRIWTVRAGKPPAPVELGAEFVHGKPPNLLDAANKATLVLQPMSASHEHWRDGHPVNTGERFGEVGKVFERLADPDLADQTFSDFLSYLNVAPDTATLAQNYVEGFNAARSDLIGTRSLAFESKAQEETDGDTAFRFEAGYDRLPQWLCSQCGLNAELALNTVVESVSWRPDEVNVECRHSSKGLASLSADRVVITLPLGVLQAPAGVPAAVHLQPRPAWLSGALEKLEMGHAARITFLFRESFWQDHPQLSDAGFIHSNNDVFPTWWTTLRGASRGLTAWAGGPKAEKVAGLADDEIAARAIDSLASILASRREAITRCVENWYFHNWSQDPFARGAYSYARVGGLEAREQLAEAVEDTLYFAGEATDTGGHGATVHGALASGHRAARQILASG